MNHQICAYCGQSRTHVFPCNYCGAPLSDVKKTFPPRSNPFFWDGYIVWYLTNPSKEIVDWVFYRGTQHCGNIQIPFRELENLTNKVGITEVFSEVYERFIETATA